MPRWTMVALLLKTTLELTAMLLAGHPGGRTHRDAPFLLRLPFEVKPVAALLGLFVVWALVQFGRRRAPIKWGVAALATLVYLAEAQTALTGDAERDFYICGALLAGWLFGLCFRRALDRQLGAAPDPDRDEVLGEAGAAGTLVAVYLNSATSKLQESGVHWADGPNLLTSVVSRHAFASDGGVLDGALSVLLAHPWIATALALSTLAIQGGMVLYLVSPRLRMLMGMLAIGFHLNVFLLMGVKYFSPIVFLVALSYPWPRIRHRLRGGPPPAAGAADEPVDPDTLLEVAQRAARWMAAIAGGVIALWLVIHHADDEHLFRDHGRDDGRGNMQRGGGPGR